jgi:hypothetical protein
MFHESTTPTLHASGAPSLQEVHELHWLLKGKYAFYLILFVTVLIVGIHFYVVFTATEEPVASSFEMLLFLGGMIGQAWVVYLVLCVAWPWWAIHREYVRSSGFFVVRDVTISQDTVDIHCDDGDSSIQWPAFQIYKMSSNVAIIEGKNLSGGVVLSRSMFRSPSEWDQFGEMVRTKLRPATLL